MSNSTLPFPLPPHCHPTTDLLRILSSYTGACLPSPLAALSYTFGLLSILSWLCAQIPQIVKNHRRKSVDGLSLGFLAIWLAGDVGNFLGAMWTDQMWFQQFIGGYYVAVDVVLVGQWAWYHGRGVELAEEDSYDEIDGISIGSSSSSGDDRSPPARYTDAKKTGSSSRRLSAGRSLTTSLLISLSLLFHLAGATPIHPHDADTPRAGFEFDRALAGHYLSWLSTFFYLISRLPQLLLNFRRRSTSGLAISLFIAAFFGNIFYSLSLLLNPLGHADYPPWGGDGIAGEDGSEWKEWWGRGLPFLLGAAGVLCMDAAVGVQYLCWGEGEVVVKDEVLGRKVAVRGWWPWSGWWSSRESEEEERRALLGERRGDGGYGI